MLRLGTLFHHGVAPLFLAPRAAQATTPRPVGFHVGVILPPIAEPGYMVLIAEVVVHL